LAREGNWTRWEPGYLLLTISRIDNKDVEPISLYTADEELTVEFGYWETHNPEPFDLIDPEVEVVVAHAKALVEDWVEGRLKTAVLTNAEGGWCGTTTIEPGELFPQLKRAAQWVRNFQPVAIEVRTLLKRDWQHFEVEPDWLSPPSLSPDRLSR